MTRISASEYVNLSGGFDGLNPPKSKYRNTPTVVDGIRFSSKAEAKRWDELRMLEKAGEIFDLKRQVSFPLYAFPGKLVGRYVADFTYLAEEMNPDKYAGIHRILHVEDVKGVRTDLFKWKARHFAAQYGYEITIIGGKR